MKKYLVLLFLLILIPLSSLAQDKVNVYVFHQYTCPHCNALLTYLDELKKDRDDFILYDYELAKDEHAFNRIQYQKVCEALDINIQSVPLVIIGNEYFIGFSDSKKDEINKYIDFYKNKKYKDVTGITLGLIDDDGNSKIIPYDDKDYYVDTIFGKINLKDLSLPIITIVIGFVDGFNPCAMWILLFLITMLFNMKDKKKMWILGLSFIGTSAFMYFLFLMAWINVNNFINSIHVLQIIVGIFAVIFGSVNLYHYFKERKQDDGCTVIKKEKRKFVFSKVTKIVENKYFILSILGVMSLAVIVNLIELLCSLGLPTMYTEILSMNNLTSSEYIRYNILYVIFFIIDDLIIFVISMITLRSTAISTKYNKYSHLIGGIIMLIIGILIIFKPEWLSFNFN